MSADDAKNQYEESRSECPSKAVWPEPQSLTAKIDPEPYPVDALPKEVRAAVEEVYGFVKAPMPLVASSALGALSLAAQAHTDVTRAEKLTGPVSLYIMIIADSGERKSTCDVFFTQAIRDYDESQATAAKSILKNHNAAMEAWEAARNGIKDKIRQLAKGGKDTGGLEAKLSLHEKKRPISPRVPRLIYGDTTPEALSYELAKKWPSGGIVTAEAGAILGAHAMGRDSIMRNLALFNMLWDAGTLVIDRKTGESFTVRGVRFSMTIQVQEATLMSFLEQSGGLARGTGFLARLLIARPESTQGSRFFTEPPKNWPALEAFNKRITEILAQSVSMNDEGALTPPLLSLGVEAKAAWVVFHDAIEKALVSGGELYDVRDAASKAADNAVRLAALFHAFLGSAGGAIGLKAFESASRIIAWHLNESRRFFGELALPAELVDAVKLNKWLISHCRQKGINILTRRDVQRNVTPARLRHKATLESALNELLEAGRVRLPEDNGRRKDIHVNPALLKGDAT